MPAMPASNTHECFTTFIGLTLKGFLRAALPLSDQSIASHTVTLVFEDGRGLTLSGNGSYWVDSVDDVKRAITRKAMDLQDVRWELQDVLALAGQ